MPVFASGPIKNYARFPIPYTSNSAGFSLTEVLVALAIAAMLTAALTRFVAGTRVNAAKVAERAEMIALGETLLARTVSSPGLRAGRTSGRADRFAWRIEIAPAAFMARVLWMNEKTAASPENAKPQATSLAAANANGSAARPGVDWVVLRVAVIVEAASGQSHVVDTIRMGSGGAGDRE